MSDNEDQGLWPYKVRFDEAERELKLDLEADDARRAVLQEAFGMIELHALNAHITTRAKPGRKPIVLVDIRLEGDVTQECGATLEAFRHPISADLNIAVIQRGHAKGVVAEVGINELSLNDLDEPDVCEDGQIDLGLYIIEALGEAYDPFARKPGAVFDEPEPEKEPSPFAALAALKTSKSTDE